MKSPTRPGAVDIQDPREGIHPIVAAAGYPTVLAVGHIGSEVPMAGCCQEEAAREADTGSAGDREVEGLDQQDGSKLTRAVGYLCLRRTWKSLLFRVSSKREIAGEYTKFCSCGGELCKPLVVTRKKITLLCVILLRPAWW